MRSFVAALLFTLVAAIQGFTVAPSVTASANTGRGRQRLFAEEERETTIKLTAEIDDARIEKLFAWVSRCLFASDERYNNLMFAFAAVFGDLPADNPIAELANDAVKIMPAENEICGAEVSMMSRQEASLGAMGAGQWTGQWKTRPHALLKLDDLTCVDDWVKTLPRGCKRTIKKALGQNFTVTAKPIPNGAAAPHSSLAHFRCVVEHEVRLLAYSPEDFFDALSEAISRYIGTTRMSGEIREYRDETGKVIAFAHEIRKGKTIRGQWFYATDQASKSYVWFHSVHSLVDRAIAAGDIDVVDLGPSGSDDFSDLKARYGFQSVDDWPAVADYLGPFWCYEKEKEEANGFSM